jgi:hypothetical protein
MSWYRVTFKSAECGPDGKSQQLINAFSDIFVANGRQPWGAAVFSQVTDDFDTVSYYFSPEAILIALNLIEFHGAVPCDSPAQASVRLAVGDDRASELLWLRRDRNN